jgi:hypothetical protein
MAPRSGGGSAVAASTPRRSTHTPDEREHALLVTADDVLVRRLPAGDVQLAALAIEDEGELHSNDTGVP